MSNTIILITPRTGQKITLLGIISDRVKRTLENYFQNVYQAELYLTPLYFQSSYDIIGSCGTCLTFQAEFGHCHPETGARRIG